MIDLGNVKVGDTLIQHSHNCKTVVVVTKVTPKQVCVGNSRFWKSGGNCVGCSSPWTSNYVALPRDGEVKEIRDRENARKALRGVRDLTTFDYFFSILRHCIDRTMTAEVAKLSGDFYQELKKCLDGDTDAKR